jgi:hypothetical protein
VLQKFLLRDEEKVMMMKIFQRLFPKQADNTLTCGRLPWIVLLLLTLVSLFRSLVHMFSPDGGAGSVAGMDLGGTGGEGIVFSFGLWGSSQLVLAIIQLLVVFQYSSLVPLMYLLLILEVLFRMLIGVIKPVEFAATPPGAIGNWVVLGLSAVMLGWCMLKIPERD